MSGKLDQSLDQIMKDAKPAGGRRGRSGRLPARKAATKSKAATTAAIAPSGGVQKKTKAAKPVKAAPALLATGESKISVYGLPQDVNEALIKDYFSSTVAAVKRVILNYGPDGRSRGSATVSFHKSGAAAEAVKLDGTKVDGRAMRIEVLVGAKAIPAAQPAKTLADRVSQPKNAATENQKKKQKEANAKATTNGSTTAAKGAKQGKKKSGRAGRPKAKTAEELDAEMQDYFVGGAPATNGAAQPAAVNGADAMVDEVM